MLLSLQTSVMAMWHKVHPTTNTDWKTYSNPVPRLKHVNIWDILVGIGLGTASATIILYFVYLRIAVTHAWMSAIEWRRMKTDGSRLSKFNSRLLKETIFFAIHFSGEYGICNVQVWVFRVHTLFYQFFLATSVCCQESIVQCLPTVSPMPASIVHQVFFPVTSMCLHWNSQGFNHCVLLWDKCVFVWNEKVEQTGETSPPPLKRRGWEARRCYSLAAPVWKLWEIFFLLSEPIGSLKLRRVSTRSTFPL